MVKSVTRRGKRAKFDQVILNRRASYDYSLLDQWKVGLVLTGLKTKAARMGRVSLKGAYVVPRTLDSGAPELFLVNASFTLQNNVPHGSGQPATVVDTASVKLLAKRREIEKIVAARNTGLTIVPLKLLVGGRYIKLIIALGKGKRVYDKRVAIKRRDTERSLKRQGVI